LEFLTSNSTQKAELTKQALYALKAIGVHIVSLTFDGCPTNVTMARLLSCNVDVSNLQIAFTVEYADKANDDIPIFMDPAHMIKLVRNAFGKKQILQHGNKYIKFDFVERLFLLQEKEGCHLANKLRKQHICFLKQKMKVELATQLLSKSVADALKSCKLNLNIPDFEEVDATIEFIEIFNSVFDILNSRSCNAINEKKALCKENFNFIANFTNMFTKYIKNLKIKEKNEFVPVLESSRKTGFIGLLVCLNSLIHLYDKLISTDKLKHIKLYKISQDHLELFFGSVRAQGDYNNNPTARQFQSAYKKLVVRVNDIETFNNGNCIPLEHIDILHYSSSDPIKVINMNSNSCNSKLDLILSEPNEFENNRVFESYINEHDYICQPKDNCFSPFTKEVII